MEDRIEATRQSASQPASDETARTFVPTASTDKCRRMLLLGVRGGLFRTAVWQVKCDKMQRESALSQVKPNKTDALSVSSPRYE